MNVDASPAGATAAALFRALEVYLRSGGYSAAPAEARAAVLLREPARGAEPLLVERRRDDLVEAGVRESGWTRSFAELVLDTADEAGLAPAFALELVRAGIGVRDLDPAPADERTTAADEMVMTEPPPELLAPAPAPGASAVREGRLRSTFRRLRHIAERGGTARAALAAFAAEPDVGRYPAGGRPPSAGAAQP